jgi:hypothetical protein
VQTAFYVQSPGEVREHVDRAQALLHRRDGLLDTRLIGRARPSCAIRAACGATWCRVIQRSKPALKTAAREVLSRFPTALVAAGAQYYVAVSAYAAATTPATS